MKTKINDNESLNDILDKMLELKRSENKTTFAQGALCVFAVLAGLIVIIFLCKMIYKNNFSMESLLSLLLAFFSIFISIFFYFKASDTSSKFYDSSYNFMKDISVTLGKIEERFGEKLNSMNEKLGHLSHVEAEKTEELENLEVEKHKMIEDILEKAKYDDNQKNNFLKRLQEKDRETEVLKRQLSKLELERSHISDVNSFINELTYSDKIQKFIDLSSKKDIYSIAEGRYENINIRTRKLMCELGLDLNSLFNNSEFHSMVKRMTRNTEIHVNDDEK